MEPEVQQTQTGAETKATWPMAINDDQWYIAITQQKRAKWGIISVHL